MKKSVCMAFCIALVVLFTTPFAFGQALDGLWFEAKVNFKGYTVDSNGLLDKVSGSGVNYLYMTYVVTGTNYIVTAYDEAGNPAPYPDTLSAIGANENIMEDLGLQFGEGSNYLKTYQTSLITIKRDKQGAIKSITINSMGCEVYDGLIDGKPVYGGCTMKAKKIDSPPFPL
jgi:hypothetical protein